MKFKFLEHTADTKIRAYGNSLEEAFENAGLALFEVICNTKQVKQKEKISFKITSEDLKSLLYDFLEELLYIHETQKLLLSKFKVNINKTSLSCEAWGEKINEAHELRTSVKAITYSEMNIEKKEDGWIIDFVVDL